MPVSLGKDSMPHIQITWIEGRTTEQKRTLATKLTELMVQEASAKPESVTIAFVDVPAENYASNGLLVADKRKKA
jgi:4-oxalocrotonate tautomerase